MPWRDRDIELAVSVAKADPDGWRKSPWPSGMKSVLRGRGTRMARADLMAQPPPIPERCFQRGMLRISRPFDFAEYYPHSARAFDDMSCPQLGKGVGLVIFLEFSHCHSHRPEFWPLCPRATPSFSSRLQPRFCGNGSLPVFLESRGLKKVTPFYPVRDRPTGAKLKHHPDVDFIILTAAPIPECGF